MVFAVTVIPTPSGFSGLIGNVKFQWFDGNMNLGCKWKTLNLTQTNEQLRTSSKLNLGQERQTSVQIQATITS
uniref:Uncharacterized protein n=1 Tax=Arundo donax TaxID=35708 RepID=A0A0A8ZWU6_ARUDO